MVLVMELKISVSLFQVWQQIRKSRIKMHGIRVNMESRSKVCFSICLCICGLYLRGICWSLADAGRHLGSIKLPYTKWKQVHGSNVISLLFLLFYIACAF